MKPSRRHAAAVALAARAAGAGRGAGGSRSAGKPKRRKNSTCLGSSISAAACSARGAPGGADVDHRRADALDQIGEVGQAAPGPRRGHRRGAQQRASRPAATQPSGRDARPPGQERFMVSLEPSWSRKNLNASRAAVQGLANAAVQEPAARRPPLGHHPTSRQPARTPARLRRAHGGAHGPGAAPVERLDEQRHGGQAVAKMVCSTGAGAPAAAATATGHRPRRAAARTGGSPASAVGPAFACSDGQLLQRRHARTGCRRACFIGPVTAVELRLHADLTSRTRRSPAPSPRPEHVGAQQQARCADPTRAGSRSGAASRGCTSSTSASRPATRSPPLRNDFVELGQPLDAAPCSSAGSWSSPGLPTTATRLPGQSVTTLVVAIDVAGGRRATRPLVSGCCPRRSGRCARWTPRRRR